MPLPTDHLNEAKIGYPNRFLSAALGCPVSIGQPFASVRNKDANAIAGISLQAIMIFIWSRHALDRGKNPSQLCIKHNLLIIEGFCNTNGENDSNEYCTCE